MLVIVHQTYSWPEAEAVTNMLSAYGLQAVLADRFMIANNWHEAIAFGGFRIMVPAQHERDALQLVAEFNASKQEDGLPESEAFAAKPVRNSLWLLLSLFFAWAPAWLRKRNR